MNYLRINYKGNRNETSKVYELMFSSTDKWKEMLTELDKSLIPVL